MKTATKSTRTRRTNTDTTANSGAVPQALQDLAADVFATNKKMNALKREHDTKRKELLQQMETLGVKSFDASATIGRSTTDITAKISTRNVETIDVEKLRELVSEEQFLAIVSATKKSVMDEVGGNVATQCTVAEVGSTNVSVKAK